MRKIAFIVALFAFQCSLLAQTFVRTFNEQIRTLRVARTFLVLNDEAIDGSDPDNTLHISFDEMSHDVHFYSYTVQMMHSDLLSGEYLRGFTHKDITDFEHSINTSREYTHYRFDFPNEEMALTKSGQYKIVIYEDNKTDEPVAEVFFCVVEPMVKIDARMRANTDEEINGRYQQMDIDINTASLDVRDPGEVRVEVVQNNRFNDAVRLTQPTYVEPKRLRYINNKALIFEGGNEYHHFDAFSLFMAGHGIDRVYHEMGDYHVLLYPDEISNGQYIHEFDSDGRYVVNAERMNDPDTEAEYMWVHWTLPAEQPWFDGALYVGGDLFGNELSLRNRMQYDAQAKVYWLTALVKQGGYDYQYWFAPKSQEPRAKGQAHKTTTTQRVDGSYWQTENEYAVYVYWRPFGARYDRLVGVSIIR